MPTPARHWLFLLVALALAVAAGCPSTQPSGPLAGGGKTSSEAKPAEPELPPDDAAAAGAIKEVGYVTEARGRVTRVELKPSATDEALKHLAGLPSVERLEANVRGVTDEGLKHLKGHPSLKYINFEQSSVTNAGMAHLKDLPRLEDVFLKKANITAEGFAHLAEIKTLKRLRAPNTQFDDACLDAIKDMQQLEVLDLSDCNLMSEEKLAVLKGFGNLRFLRLWGPVITDKVVGYLRDSKSLFALSLDNAVISDAAFEHIATLSNLQELMLNGANVTDAKLEKLKDLTKLKKLELRDCGAVTSLGMSYLSGMAELRELDLTNTTIGNEGLEHLKGLTNLETLNLWSTRIDDSGLVHLESLPNLKWLKLDQCNVGDKGMKSVGKLANLEYLHIGSTQVTDDGLKSLYGLKKLKELVLTFVSGVSDSGVEELQAALPQLETIDR